MTTGFFQNQFGTVHVNSTTVCWLGVLPEVATSEAFILLSGPFKGSLPELFRNKYQPARDDIFVRFSEDGQVAVEVTVQVLYGVPIRPAATRLQENIERAIAAATGLVVQKVDIKVDRIYHRPPETATGPDNSLASLEYTGPVEQPAPESQGKEH